MRTVQNILDTKPVPSNITTPNTRVIDALQGLLQVNLSYLVVMENDDYEGVFCERDYCRNVVLKGRSSSAATVAEVMTTDLPRVQPGTTVEQCIHLINSHRTRYLVAYDGEHFAGIITIHDLMREVLRSRKDVFDSAVDEMITSDEGGFVY